MGRANEDLKASSFVDAWLPYMKSNLPAYSSLEGIIIALAQHAEVQW